MCSPIHSHNGFEIYLCYMCLLDSSHFHYMAIQHLFHSQEGERKRDRENDNSRVSLVKRAPTPSQVTVTGKNTSDSILELFLFLYPLCSIAFATNELLKGWKCTIAGISIPIAGSVQNGLSLGTMLPMPEYLCSAHKKHSEEAHL